MDAAFISSTLKVSSSQLLPSSRNLGRYWPNQRLPFKSSQTGDTSPIEAGCLYLVDTERIFIWPRPRGISQIYWKTFIFHKWKILLGPKCFMDFSFGPHELVPFWFHIEEVDNLEEEFNIKSKNNFIAALKKLKNLSRKAARFNCFCKTIYNLRNSHSGLLTCQFYGAGQSSFYCSTKLNFRVISSRKY